MSNIEALASQVTRLPAHLQKTRSQTSRVLPLFYPFILLTHSEFPSFK